MGELKITWFSDSPDAGDPACICSLCDELIPLEDVPIRLFDRENDLEARFHLVCFELSGLKLSPSDFAVGDDTEEDKFPHSPGSRMPRFYIPPLGLPHYWRNDVTGELRAAVGTLAEHMVDDEENPPPDAGQVALLKDYFRHYIHAPCWDGEAFADELAHLREQVQKLEAINDIWPWIRGCMEIGIDPL